jgi:signal transduction histidine kinase
MSLRTRLLVGLAVLVLTAVVSSGWVLLAVAESRTRQAEEAQGTLLAEQVVRVLLPEALQASWNRARIGSARQSLIDRGVVADVTVMDPAGNVIAGDLRPDPRLRETHGLGFEVREGARFVYAPLGAGVVRLQVDARHATLTNAKFLLVSVAGVMTVITLIFGALFVRRVIGPVEALAAAADRIAAGELEVPRIDEGTQQDEVARLTHAFNQMAASLRAQRDQMVAQEKLATVGRLSAGVAHEVGNPLAAVLGYLDLMLPDEKDPERRDMLERARKETDRIRVIIADLLDYSRPVAGEREPVDLREAVESSVSLLRPQARFRGVEVRDEIPADLPRASASASRLTQVLVNLLLNAADAMAGAGSIHLSARADESWLTLVVRDTGPGVPAADRGRIFDPFFTTKEPGAGTGLGLAISRSIVEAMGGQLTLEDSPSGATFSVRLPRWTNVSAEG